MLASYAAYGVMQEWGKVDQMLTLCRFRPGRVGEYKVLKVLGAGSFAQVAVGEHEKTGEKVSCAVLYRLLLLTACLLF